MNRYVRLLCICILSCILIPLPAEGESVELYTTTDLAAVDALWQDHISFRASVGCILTDGVGLELPIVYTVDRSGGEEILMDIALKLMVFPWGSGPFISLSLTQACIFMGPFIPEDRVHYLNEIAIGYTWNVIPGWFIRPSVIYRDPSNNYGEDFAYIEALVPTRKKVRFCLEVGWLFASLTQ